MARKISPGSLTFLYNVYPINIMGAVKMVTLHSNDKLNRIDLYEKSHHVHHHSTSQKHTREPNSAD